MRAAGQWLEAHPDPARQMVRARAFILADLGSPSQQRLQAALGEILTTGQQRGKLREVPVADAVTALQCGYCTGQRWSIRISCCVPLSSSTAMTSSTVWSPDWMLLTLPFMPFGTMMRCSTTIVSCTVPRM